MRRAAIVAALCLAAVVSPPTLEAQSPSAAGQPTVSQASLEAASELLMLLQMEEVMLASMRATIDAQMNAQPAMAPFRDVMISWAEKHMSWEKVGARFATVYAESFTERELRDMIAFYMTPTGRKLAAAMPDLTRRGAEIGAAIGQENMADLQQMLEARARELQNGPPRR